MDRPQTAQEPGTGTETRVGLPQWLAPGQQGPQEPLEAAETAPGPGAGLTGPQTTGEQPYGASSETPSDAGPAAADSEAPWNEDESGVDEPGKPRRTGSSRTSSRAEREALQATVGQAFVMGTTVAHLRLTAEDTPERVLGLYLADAEDVDNVSDPAASLLQRHTGGELGNPDVADGLSILFAFGNYLIKQWAKLAQAKAVRSAAVEFDQQLPDGQAAA